jgi:glycosyltransferase involved in cell wall biosynthesis
MRTLWIIHSVNPASGGAIEAVKQLGQLLNSRGCTCEVACLDPPDAPWLKTFPLKVHALGPGITGYGYSPNFVPWLKQNAGNYDCAIANGIWQYSSFGTWLALHKTSTPYFVFTHGMLDPWFKRTYPLKHLKKWFYWLWAEYKVLRDAQAVLFTCEEERILARQSFWLYKCHEVVVNFGTAAPEGNPLIQRQAFLERFPQLRGKRLLLFLSRIHVKKGCDLLIKSFAKVAHLDDSLHLVIAGPDQTGWQPELQKIAAVLDIQQKITWTGMLSGNLKWGAFYASEVLVLPSHQENFGIVVAEALACSVPVLISNKVNIWREIVAQKAGLVANDDLEGTTQLLQDWLAMSPNQQQVMQQNAQRCFTKHFEVNKSAQSLVKIWNSKGTQQ